MKYVTGISLRLSTFALSAMLLAACGNDPSLLDPDEFSPSAIPLDVTNDGAAFSTRGQSAAAQFAWVTMTWQSATGDSAVNLDLHVVDPNGEEINLTNTAGDDGRFLEHPECASFDCDGNERDPRETVYWRLRELPPGEYRAWVENISDRSASFDIGIVFGGHREEGSGTVAPGDRSREWTWNVSADDCLRRLTQAGVQFEPTTISEGSCSAENGVMISSPFDGITYRVDWSRSTTRFRTSCETALAIHELNQTIRAQGITEVYHDGSFRCRNIKGSSNRSTHASARAMDYRGFKGSGEEYIVLDHWSDETKGPVLRNIAAAGQSIFQTVLTPDSDADHRDHFHMDIGR